MGMRPVQLCHQTINNFLKGSPEDYRTDPADSNSQRTRCISLSLSLGMNPLGRNM